MTESEAIGYLKTLKNRIPIRFFTNDGAKKYDEFCKKSISALEKQISKKPKPVKVDFQNCTCRCRACNSKNIVGYDAEYDKYDIDDKFIYCSDCGQRLDWSDYNEVN